MFWEINYIKTTGELNDSTLLLFGSFLIMNNHIDLVRNYVRMRLYFI